VSSVGADQRTIACWETYNLDRDRVAPGRPLKSLILGLYNVDLQVDRVVLSVPQHGRPVRSAARPSFTTTSGSRPVQQLSTRLLRSGPSERIPIPYPPGSRCVLPLLVVELVHHCASGTGTLPSQGVGDLQARRFWSSSVPPWAPWRDSGVRNEPRLGRCLLPATTRLFTGGTASSVWPEPADYPSCSAHRRSRGAACLPFSLRSPEDSSKIQRSTAERPFCLMR
jgi:hypothetical protein